MVNLAIVEDEDYYVEQITKYIDRYQQERGTEFKITRFRDGDEIVEQYRGEFDIILMDIQMQFMDGMAAAEKIREVDKEVIIMFITNMTQYAVRGYQVDALDYMVKPIEYFSFSQKLERALERMKKRDDYFISISVKDGIQKINISELYYIESSGHTLIYRTEKGAYESRGVMKDVESAMIPHGFFRSNKGYLVNMKYVDGIRENCCVIAGELLPISRAKKKQFMEELTNYMSGVMK